MSHLQTVARPYLLPLIRGEPMALDQKGQEIVAAWIAMTVCVAEHFTKSIAVPTRARWHIRRTKTAPSDWRIWIANLERGDWMPYLIHHPFLIPSAKHRLKKDKSGRLVPNTQTSTMTVKELYIFAASSPTRIFDDWRFPRTEGAEKLKQIWPLRRNIVGWPGASLSGREADSIAGSFFRFSEMVGRAVGAPPIS